jgi:hypothetical protein
MDSARTRPIAHIHVRRRRIAPDNTDTHHRILLMSAENAVGCGIVMIALNAKGARFAW